MEDEVDVARVPHLNGQGLRASFSRARILGWPILVVIASAMLMLQGDGVICQVFPTSEKNDKQHQRLVSWYNSISGNIDAFVPVKIFLGLLQQGLLAM
ncbi:hypothetical protein Gpo141_00011472 [Globisporangium polare]